MYPVSLDHASMVMTNGTMLNGTNGRKKRRRYSRSSTYDSQHIFECHTPFELSRRSNGRVHRSMDKDGNILKRIGQKRLPMTWMAVRDADLTTKTRPDWVQSQLEDRQNSQDTARTPGVEVWDADLLGR